MPQLLEREQIVTSEIPSYAQPDSGFQVRALIGTPEAFHKATVISESDIKDAVSKTLEQRSNSCSVLDKASHGERKNVSKTVTDWTRDTAAEFSKAENIPYYGTDEGKKLMSLYASFGVEFDPQKGVTQQQMQKFHEEWLTNKSTYDVVLQLMNHCGYNGTTIDPEKYMQIETVLPLLLRGFGENTAHAIQKKFRVEARRANESSRPFLLKDVLRESKPGKIRANDLTADEARLCDAIGGLSTTEPNQQEAERLVRQAVSISSSASSQTSLQIPSKPSVPSPDQGINPRDTFIRTNVAESETARKVREVKEALLNMAENKDIDRLKKLLSDVTEILKKEKVEGLGKLKDTIQETADAVHTYTRDGEVVFLPKTKGKLVVIGDIHGDLETAKHLLNKEEFIENMETGDKSTQLVFLGDLVDRGAKSVEVMQFVLELKRRYPDRVTIMRADHEVYDGVDPHDFPNKVKKHFGFKFPDPDLAKQKINEDFDIRLLGKDGKNPVLLTGAPDFIDKIRTLALSHTLASIENADLDEYAINSSIDANLNTISGITLTPDEKKKYAALLKTYIATYKKTVELHSGSLGGFFTLFEELPAMTVSGNGGIFVHGGPPVEARTLAGYAKLNKDEIYDVFDRQIIWADPLPESDVAKEQGAKDKATRELEAFLNLHAGKGDDEIVPFDKHNLTNVSTTEKGRLRELRALLKKLQNSPDIFFNAGRVDTGSYYDAVAGDLISYAKAAITAFKDGMGGSYVIRAHQVSSEVDGGKPNMFGDILWTIHSTGKGSDESYYKQREQNPCYAVFAMDSAQSKVEPGNIKPVWEAGTTSVPKTPDIPKPHPDYLALGDEVQKRTYLQQLYDKYFPAGTPYAGRVELKRGYFFFPAFSPRTINGRDFRAAYQDATASRVHFQFPDRYKTEVAAEKSILAQEYKVHLMPKAEYTPFILEQLFNAMQEDPELAKVISEIKVINKDEKIDTEDLPGIVIYTQLGKGKAQEALNRLYQRVSKFEPIGRNKTPRYNQKVNNLIYYAQSGGDWKNDYITGVKSAGKDIAADGIFEPDLIHFAGDYKLTIPSGI